MPESYSVNQLKTWNKCPKKYEFDYVRKLLWPSNPKNFRLGKGVHQLLDYDSRDLPMEPILRDTDVDIRQVWQTLKQSRWTQLPIIASEWGFSLEMDGGWIYGRIDRIVRYHETVHILDWKTGTGIPLAPESDWQTVVYLYAVYAAQKELGLSILAEQLAFTYVQVKGQAIKEVTVNYSEDFHQNTKQRLSHTLNTLKATRHFALPKVCPDRFCPYSNICGIKTEESARPLSAVTSLPPAEIQ